MSREQAAQHLRVVTSVKRFAHVYPEATPATVLQEMRARGLDPQGLPDESPLDAVARWMKEARP